MRIIINAVDANEAVLVKAAGTGARTNASSFANPHEDTRDRVVGKKFAKAFRRQHGFHGTFIPYIL
jgi:hypothetical protein